MATEADDQPTRGRNQMALFRTTRWSVVFAAQGKTSAEVRSALEILCRQYWPPLFAYVRFRGNSEQDSQDLTQEFFARLLEKGWLTAADNERGRFRTFLLVAMKRFLANEWDRAQTQKRGGSVRFITIDAANRISIPDQKGISAESHFERDWALTLLELAMSRLKEEHESTDRIALFEKLKPCLTAERGNIDYVRLAADLKMEPASARSAVHRLRKRFREIFREEVAGTVADPDEVDDEIRSVIAALGSQ